MISRQNEKGLIKALFYLVARLLRFQFLFAFISTILSFSGPFFLNMIIRYVENSIQLPYENAPYFLILGLFTSSIVRCISNGQMYFIGRRMGRRIRSALMSEIYAKSHRRYQHTTHDDASSHTGEIISLMSVDTMKILECSCYLMYIWTTPLQIIFCISYLMTVLGWAAWAGIILMCIMAPLGGLLGKQIAKQQRRLMKSTDKRIQSINEVILYPGFI